MIRRIFAALTLAAGAPFAQASDPLSYSFWDVQYLNSTVDLQDEGEDEVEGMRSQLSIGLSPYLNFTGDWDLRRYANGRDSFVSAGIGTHTQHPTFQVFGAVTYERYDADDNLQPDADVSNEGYGVQLGMRVRVPHVALHASYKYYDLGDGDEIDVIGGRYGAGLAVQLSPWWALVGDVAMRESEYEVSATGTTADVEYEEWSVGFRRYFATDADRRLRKGGIFAGRDNAAEGYDEE